MMPKLHHADPRGSSEDSQCQIGQRAIHSFPIRKIIHIITRFICLWSQSDIEIVVRLAHIHPSTHTTVCRSVPEATFVGVSEYQDIGTHYQFGISGQFEIG